VNAVQKAELFAPEFFNKSLLGGVSNKDGYIFLTDTLIVQEKAKAEGKLGFERVEEAGTANFTLLFAAVVEEENVPAAHRRNGGILVSAWMVKQLAVDGRNDKSGHVVAHSMLHLQSDDRESEADEALKETHVHSELGRQQVDVAGRPQLLMIAYHNQVLADGCERRYDVRFQNLRGLFNHN
jgi:hypothetical protein